MSLERDWKAEKKDLQEAFDIIADKLVKADAEIERLKSEQIKMFKAYDAIEQKLVGQKSLIAELAKALEKSNPDRYKTLIQRAREAINATRR